MQDTLAKVALLERATEQIYMYKSYKPGDSRASLKFEQFINTCSKTQIHRAVW